MQYLNIGHLVKGDDIGLLSLKDGQSLFGRTGMRLPNRQLVVGMGLIPLLNEGFVERREQFTGNVVGGVEQLRSRSRHGSRGAEQRSKRKAGGCFLENACIHQRISETMSESFQGKIA